VIEKWLSKNEAAIVDREGKSDIWKLFGAVEREEKVISNFVACKACKKVYTFKPSDGTQSLRKHNCSGGNSGPVAKSMPQKHRKVLWLGSRWILKTDQSLASNCQDWFE